MEVLILLIFVAGYVVIALEQSLMVSKAATALLTGIGAWTAYIVMQTGHATVLHALETQVAEISGILFFLMGAMTIVELIDLHGGFDILTKVIRTRSKRSLMWTLCLLTFFLSAVLDNLTTSIVMVSLLRKLIDDRQTRLLFAGMVVVAANAGGAWSPIGDVTTTMLWINEKFTPIPLILHTFLPSLVSLVLPLGILSLWMKGKVKAPALPVEPVESQAIRDGGHGWAREENPRAIISEREKLLVLALGVGGLVFVPVFKLLTHLPPFMGMMLVLAMLWIVTEFMNKRRRDQFKEKFSAAYALERIDIPSMLFFLGILLAVGALQVSGILTNLAGWLDGNLPNRNVVVAMIGLLSSIVDNVPLVSGAIHMYEPSLYPELATPNHPFWLFLGYCAGTGGSVLLIGSAPGVAVMGMERMEFFWYVRRIAPLALVGYFAGMGTFLLMA